MTPPSILIPACISDYFQYIVWDEITYPFTHFNGRTVDAWGWIRNVVPHFTGHVITYPCWDKSCQYNGPQAMYPICHSQILHVRPDGENQESLPWRHNEHDGVSNKGRLDCLLNRLFRSRKYQNSAPLVLVRGIHGWPVDSLHKGPVTPFDDVITLRLLLNFLSIVWHLNPTQTHFQTRLLNGWYQIAWE